MVEIVAFVKQFDIDRQIDILVQSTKELGDFMAIEKKKKKLVIGLTTNWANWFFAVV